MFTLAEVSSFIVHSEKCIVKTFKQGKGSKIAKDMTDLGFCLEKKGSHVYFHIYESFSDVGEI